MPVDFDYYTILQLTPRSSAEEVREQWRRLAKAYHPDKHAGDPWFEEQLKLINQAYEVLRDPKQKEIYDLRFQPKPEPVKPAPPPKTEPKPPPKPAPKPAAASPSRPASVKPAPSKPAAPKPVLRGVKAGVMFKRAYDILLGLSRGVAVLDRRQRLMVLGSIAVVVLLLVVWQLSLKGNSSASPPAAAIGTAERLPDARLPPSPGAVELTPIPSPVLLPPQVDDPLVKSSGADDPEKAIAAQRAQEAKQLASLKDPLLRRYQAVLPRINALIAQGESALKTNAAFTEQALHSDEPGRTSLMARLAADTEQLRSSRDYVKSSLDSMQWYGTGTMWVSQSLDIGNALQELENPQQPVSKDIQALSGSYHVTSKSSQSLLPGFQGATDLPR